MSPSARHVLYLGVLLLAAGPARAVDVRQDLALAAPEMQPCPGRPGFVRLPGSSTCTHLSARVSVSAVVRADRAGTTAGPLAASRLNIDNRTDTDLGEVRTFVRLGMGRR